MKILHVIPSISLDYGGPSRSSVNLANNLASKENINIFFYFQSSDVESRLSLDRKVNEISISADKSNYSLKTIAFYFDLRKIILKKGIQLLHIHGIWHPICHWAAVAARSLNIPYIIQPRGMLEPWAVNYKFWKKRVALWLYQRSDLLNATALIATSHQEANSLRSMIPCSNIVVIPNGVEKIVDSNPKYSDKTKKIALFLSRIHPKKGVLDLVNAWALVNHENWILRIVGPDDGGHINLVIALIRTLGLEDKVEVIGAQYGENRVLEFHNADLFVLPTYSENFGIAIVEALAYGIPVVTTTGAPWAEIVEYKCGWWVEPGIQSLADTLKSALKTSDQDFFEMGKAAKTLARKYDWESVATHTYDLYSKILNKH